MTPEELQQQRIKNFESYIISTDGRVYSTISTKYLKPNPDGRGYPMVIFQKRENRKAWLIHRLVANAFIPNPENKRCINHIDGDKTNNNVENLEWCTHSENILHAYRLGLHSRVGENHRSAKLTQSNVSEIRKLISAGNSCRSIGDEFGVSTTAISKIKHGITWKP